MSRKTPLSSQTRKVCIVIRKNKDISKDLIKQYCDSEFERYAFIEHKGDRKADTGEIEGTHYHIVGDFKSNKTPLTTRLNTICKWFKFDNQNGLEIEQYRTFEGALQYLTHKNQPEKTPHKKEEIITNLDKQDFDIFYEASVGEVITFDFLFSVILNADNIVDVIRELGLNNYRTWRNVVWDMYNEIHKRI